MRGIIATARALLDVSAMTRQGLSKTLVPKPYTLNPTSKILIPKLRCWQNDSEDGVAHRVNNTNPCKEIWV